MCLLEFVNLLKLLFVYGWMFLFFVILLEVNGLIIILLIFLEFWFVDIIWMLYNIFFFKLVLGFIIFCLELNENVLDYIEWFFIWLLYLIIVLGVL